MAVRSLGQLTLDLVAKIGGFTRGMTEAERVADKSSREIARKNRERAKEVEKAWQGATKFVAGAFAGLSVAGLFSTFIRESVNAQNEQAQLAAALKSTGQAAGFSAEQLNSMATAMAGNSIFSEGDINKAQTRLLAYTGIVGEQFPAAMQAVIDMSARLGMSVEQSAETIGKALDIPSQGLTALQRQGFRFTEEQKKAVEQLEKTGRVAEAQAIVLEALKSSYGGAAQAARNTLGGALTALQEQLRTLMTGDDGSLEGVREAVEDLIKLLASPEAKAGFAAMVEGLANITRGVVTAVLEVSRFSKFVGETFARQLEGSADPIERLDAEIVKLGVSIDRTQKGIASFGSNPTFVNGLKTELTEYQRQLDVARRARAMLATERSSVAAPPVTSPASGGVRPPSEAEQRALAAAAARREAAERAGRDAARQAQAYIENLRKQLQATESLSVAETVLRDIQAGRVKLAGGVTQQQLLDIAKQIDLARERIKTEEDVRKAMEATAEMQKRADDAAVDEVQKLIDSNQALREEIELIGLEGKALAAVESARVSSAIALKEEALAMAQNAEASATVVQSLEREIALLKQRQGLLADRGQRRDEAKEVEEMAKRQEQAYKNIQDALGQGLYDIATGSFKDIGRSFTQMLTRMAAEAVAADIMKSIFGKGSSGQGGSAFGDIFSIFSGLFGGGRAAGGPVSAGRLYEVNENGPEMLAMNGRQYLMMGNQGGTVMPNAGGKSISFSLVQQFAPGTDRRTMTQAAAEAQRYLEAGARNL